METSKEEKEDFWLRVRTFIFQLLVVIGILILVGLLPSPINVWVTIFIVAVMFGWKKIFRKDKQ